MQNNLLLVRIKSWPCATGMDDADHVVTRIAHGDRVEHFAFSGVHHDHVPGKIHSVNLSIGARRGGFVARRPGSCDGPLDMAISRCHAADRVFVFALHEEIAIVKQSAWERRPSRFTFALPGNGGIIELACATEFHGVNGIALWRASQHHSTTRNRRWDQTPVTDLLGFHVPQRQSSFPFAGSCPVMQSPPVMRISS